MKQFLTILLLSAICVTAFAQKELVMTQYIHNQFAINPAFAGSRETLSAFGAYRMQWSGIPDAPNAQYFSMHAPLKNNNVALGLSFFNENVSIVRNTGFSAAYAYRVKTGQDSRVAFSLNAGLLSSKSSWDRVSLSDPADPAFGENETYLQPMLGFGMAWYSQVFFAGFSIPDLFYTGTFDNESLVFEPSQTSYLLTAGYLYAIHTNVSLQPSTLIRYNPDQSTIADLSVNILLQNRFWTGITYRTNNEIIGMAGWQASPQLRVAYSFDYPTGDLSNLNSGSHELSLQYDFGYKINTVNPRFF